MGRQLQAIAPIDRQEATLAVPASPFLKWAGGKSQLLKVYQELLPRRFARYFEPFLGGGAVFFHLANRHPGLRAILSDCNAELINCYTIVRDHLPELIEALKCHRNDRHHFYKVRAMDLELLDQTERAARLIFLNRTCFNGLYRVNRKGQFNVPFGKYKNPKILDEINLTGCRSVLADADISCQSFEHVVKRARTGDFVYMDPPYHPLNATSNFTSYTNGAFRFEDQMRLADVFRALDRKGCLVMLSNSDTPEIRELYQGYRIEVVLAARAINSRADRRGRINELVVLNYPNHFSLQKPSLHRV